MTGPLRAARASVFALACLGISAAGHAWMSGRPVPATAMAPGFVLAFALGFTAARRRRGLVPISALMLAGELALHLLFTAAQHTGTGAGAAMPGMADMPGMTMPGTPTASSANGVPMAAMAGHGTLGMVAVHAAAGLAGAWWIHRGELALFAILRIAADEAAALFLPPARPPVPSPAASRQPCVPRVCPVCAYPEPLAHVLVRRGPPRLAG